MESMERRGGSNDRAASRASRWRALTAVREAVPSGVPASLQSCVQLRVFHPSVLLIGRMVKTRNLPAEAIVRFLPGLEERREAKDIASAVPQSSHSCLSQ